ncbi:MAG: class I SAM-dependent methyltransferase [Woeseiaceae bacterium]
MPALIKVCPDISDFKDHFSGHAGSYSAHRPAYPDSLFVFLASCAGRRERAWDCATGNGQAAASLAKYFENVIATDASAEQIASATPTKGVEFGVAKAEASALPAGSVDLVTVAQALHWFDIEQFFAESVRVLRPGGVLAIWAYGHCHVDQECDAVVRQIFAEVESFWPPEREIVESGYAGITLPVSEFQAEDFAMAVDWTVDQIVAYMRTWSASQRYIKANGTDPTSLHHAELAAAWGDSARTVTWPITLRVGRR